MENTAKKATKKTSVKTPNSLNKIAKTAKTINTEVKETASDILDEVVAEGKAVRAIATKSAKEVASNIHIKENVAKIKATAQKINSQIKETTTEILGDVVANRKELQANANKMAIEAIENVNITERVASLKKTVKNVNDFTFETAEELVDGMIVNGEKWQGVASKAVKSSLKVAGRQQDIVFSTLETVKGQLTNSAARLKNIFKN